MQSSAGKPAINVVAGPAHSAKTARVIDAFRQVVEAGSEAVLILPTAQAAASLRTGLLLDETFDFLGGSRVLTFVQMAELVLRQHAPDVQPIDQVVEDELIRRIVDRLAKAGELAHHKDVVGFRGFSRAVRSFIMELKRAEITPSVFEKFASRKGASGKDRELSAIYSRYQGRLQELGLYDEQGRFWRARTLVSEGRLGPFARLSHVFIDAFYDFTPAQLGFIESLSRRGVAITMSLPLEDSPGRRELFESPRATFEKLSERFAIKLEMLPAKQLTAPDLMWLADRLFDAEAYEGAPRPESIGLIEAPGTVAEVREIAREIKRLHIEQNIPLENCAVVFRTLGDYRDVVDEVFEEFGIPVRVAQGIRLSLTPVGQLVLQILSVVSKGWQCRDVMGLLKSNYTSPDEIGLGDDGLNLSRFEDMVVEAGVIRGSSSWSRNIQLLRDRIAARLAGSADMPDADTDRNDDAELKEKLANIGEAEAVVGRLIDLFRKLENARSVGELATELLDIIRKLKVNENIVSRSDELTVARDLASMEAVRECMASLVRTSNIVGEESSSLVDFTKSIRLAFGETTVRRKSSGFGEVAVLGVHDVRALSFDVVFVGGLLERSFPMMHREGPFYDDRERAAMNRGGLEIHPRRLSQREERFLFYLTVTRARKRLYLSFPATDREGKEKLVSYYVGEVRRAFLPHDVDTRLVTLSTRTVGIGESSSARELRLATILRLSERKLVDAGEVVRAAALLAAYNARTALVCRRSLEGEAERDNWQPFGLHDGVLEHPSAVAELTERFGAGHDFSATSLENYGVCPFAFFCRSVLKIAAAIEAPEEFEARDDGNILHRTLRGFYCERRDRSEDARISEEDIEAATRRIRQIVDAQLDRFRSLNPDMNEGLLKLQQRELHGVVDNFVRSEAQLAKKDKLGMIPRFFEVSFGPAVNRAAADPLSSSKRLVVPIPGADSASIVGAIDRIDVTEKALESGRQGFRIIDYKRGLPGRAKTAIMEGTSLQIPLYVVAARDVVLAGKKMEPVDAQLYALRKMNVRTAMSRVRKPRKGDPTWDELLNAAEKHVRNYVRAIRRAEFPVMRQGVGCPPYCEFSTICRYSEWRERKKLGEVKPWFAGRSHEGESETETDE